MSSVLLLSAICISRCGVLSDSTNWGAGMNSDALVVAVATGIAACAMLVGLAFASWLAGRSRTGAAEPVAPAARLPPSVADGVAPKQLPVLAQELSAHAYSAAQQAAAAARVAREELHVVEVAEAAVRQEAADAALEAQDAAIAVRARRRRR